MIRKITCYLALAISLIIFMSSCAEKTAYPVGKLQGSNALVNDDISKAKKYFEFILKNAKITGTLTDFSILQKEDLGTRESYYILLGTGDGGRLKVAQLIFLSGENRELGITSESLKMPSIICQSDCAAGCAPGRKNGAWTCSDDCKSDCRTTETIAYEENNYTTPIQAFLEKY